MSVLRDFQTAGHDLFILRMNNSHSGNLSMRQGRSLAITRTGAMLHRIEHGDVVETLIERDDAETPRASREIPVHRAIYLGTKAEAIVHAHPPHIVALSFLRDRICPIDAEGQYYFPQGIPVLTVQKAVGSEEVAAGIVPLLRQFPVAVVRGHGSFAIGKDLEEAMHWTSSLENSAQIACLHAMLARASSTS